MKDDSWSWSKPDNVPGLAGRKKVDKTLIETGTTAIPIEFHEEFPTVEKIKQQKLQNATSHYIITLIYEGKRYEGRFARKSTGRIFICVVDRELKEKIKAAFVNSSTLINEKRKELMTQKKYVIVPDELAEYVEYYLTNEPDTYEIKLVTNEAMRITVDNMKKNVSKQTISDTRDVLDIDKIYKFIEKQGIIYGRETLSNFYLSLKSKPFVILSGISGTGKSKLVRLFAEAIGAEFTLISVRPDWSDATELLGYKDLNQKSHLGRLTQVIQNASENRDKPYIVCLDEMNLARVEYYFSDFLSLIESRRRAGGKIITDSFTQDLDVTYKSLPDNLYIVGTVNMDETTFQFSRKVLDRANTIELSDIDLLYDFEEEILEEVMPLCMHNEALRSEFLLLKDCKAHKELATRVIEQLIAINELLMPCRLEFAYRVRDEVVFYMAYNEEYDLLSEEEAFDFQMMQKVLPRITGTSCKVERLLMNLINLWTDETITLSELEDTIDEAKVLQRAYYPKSVKKLIQMLGGYRDDGFTSFW